MGLSAGYKALGEALMSATDDWMLNFGCLYGEHLHVYNRAAFKLHACNGAGCVGPL